MDRSLLPARFWAKVREDASGCWVWTGCSGGGGYGYIWGFGEALGTHRAHRVAYLTLVGSIPEGLELDHLCRNRACVNPHHLEPVTHAENARRGAAGNLRPPSARCPSGHALTEDNLYVDRRGNRNCRKCNADRQRRFRERAAAKT